MHRSLAVSQALGGTGPILEPRGQQRRWPRDPFHARGRLECPRYSGLRLIIIPDPIGMRAGIHPYKRRLFVG